MKMKPYKYFVIIVCLLTNTWCCNSLENNKVASALPQYSDSLTAPKTVIDTVGYASKGYKAVGYEEHLLLNPKNTFEMHRVPVYNGQLKPIEPHPKYTFGGGLESIIQGKYKKEGVNFGGHYWLIQHSCGGPCTVCKLVDCRTGKIYSGGVDGCGESFIYHKNSRMLIVNPIKTNKQGYFTPTDVEDYFPCKRLHQIFVWDDEKKVFEELESIELLFREKTAWMKNI